MLVSAAALGSSLEDESTWQDLDENTPIPRLSSKKNVENYVV